MRKIFYLCGMMLLCMDMMAQIDENDKNWKVRYYDDFDAMGRQFGSDFHEPLGKWISYAWCLWPSGVTKSNCYQIYQYDRAVFDAANNVIRLNSQYIQSTPISCDDNVYEFPTDLNYHCDEGHNQLYYESGIIETPHDTTFRYGYFEICCEQPIHDGAFPAFWLWGAESGQFYEEIDIFESSRYFTDPSMAVWTHNPEPQGCNDFSTFTTGIYYNDSGSSSSHSTSQARNYPSVRRGTDLTDLHTFACEWMPDHVIWYCDKKVVNEYYNSDSIPHHSLTLKANYAIDRYAMADYGKLNPPAWLGSDSFVIHYIKVYQLKWDCDTDELITCQTDLDGFAYAVKKSISITSAIEPVRVASNEKVTFRATDSFEITGSFQTDVGTELTVIMQECPE